MRVWFVPSTSGVPDAVGGLFKARVDDPPLRPGERSEKGLEVEQVDRAAPIHVAGFTLSGDLVWARTETVLKDCKVVQIDGAPAVEVTESTIVQAGGTVTLIYPAD